MSFKSFEKENSPPAHLNPSATTQSVACDGKAAKIPRSARSMNLTGLRPSSCILPSPNKNPNFRSEKRWSRIGLPSHGVEDSWDEIPVNETTAIYGHTAIRVAIIGDAGVGKSTLINTFAFQMGVRVSDETPFRMIQVPNLASLSTPSILNLVDTQAGDRVAKFRTLNYQGTHAVVLSFAVNDRRTFESIKNEWIDEVEFYCPDVPVILVGTKVDLRSEDGTCVSPQEAKQLAWDMKVAGYYEVTSKDPHTFVNVLTSITKLICRIRSAMVQRAIERSSQRTDDATDADEEMSTLSPTTSPIVQKIFHRLKSSQNFLRSSLRLR